VLRALARPRFSVWISRQSYWRAMAAVASVEPSSTTMTSSVGKSLPVTERTAAAMPTSSL